MFGDNPIRPIITGNQDVLDVKEIFYTIQGEGPYAGIPAIFIRLGGCNLACKFCDTEFENYDQYRVEKIIQNIESLKNSEAAAAKLIVITGGEPLRQSINDLCIKLLDMNFLVQIETNGTIFRDLDKRVKIICSPKNNGKGYFPIRSDLLERVSAFKFLLSKNNQYYKEVPDVGQYKYNTEIFVQPMDEYDDLKNKNNLEYAIYYAMRHGYRLSLQLHKIMGVR